MTQDQIILLLDLKASQERGSASMSCDQRRAIAHELERNDLITWHGEMFGSTFYYINQKGLAALKNAERKIK